MHTINLNIPGELTRENVARLIGSVSDAQTWQLRVRKDSVAYLSDIVGNAEYEDLLFCLETWAADNEYVGHGAAHDKNWVDQVYRTLKVVDW